MGTGVRDDENQTVLRLQRNFWNETLTLTALASIYGETGEDGALNRFTAEYDLNDNLTATVGVIFYESGDLPIFESIGSNDCIFCDMKWSF